MQESRTVPQLDKIRFGRSRFLAAVAAALFGVLTRDQEAFAMHAAATPCDGQLCHCCGTSNCTPNTEACTVYGGNGHCWYECHFPTGQYYKCCDFISGVGNFCVCRTSQGAC